MKEQNRDGLIMKIKVKGEMSLAEIRMALVEKLLEIEDDLAVRRSPFAVRRSPFAIRKAQRSISIQQMVLAMPWSLEKAVVKWRTSTATVLIAVRLTNSRFKWKG
jgi:hypothetical protein